MATHPMNEQTLLTKWRNLSRERQQQVVEFIEFLELKQQQPQPIPSTPSPTPLGEKLQHIRDRIVTSGAPLLTDDQIEDEVRERRGGYPE